MGKFFYWLFGNLTSFTLIAFTSQSSYVCTPPLWPLPPQRKEKYKSILYCLFLVTSPPSENNSFSTCICTRSHQLRRAECCPDKGGASFPMPTQQPKMLGQLSCTCHHCTLADEGWGQLSHNTDNFFNNFTYKIIIISNVY